MSGIAWIPFLCAEPLAPAVVEFLQMFIFVYIFLCIFIYVYVYLHICCVFWYSFLCDKCPTGPPGTRGGPPRTPGGVFQECKKCNFWSVAISIFWPSHESGAKTARRARKLERKSPTSAFDMPSSRCYEAKREKMFLRATLRKISGSRRSGDFLFGAFAVLLR